MVFITLLNLLGLLNPAPQRISIFSQYCDVAEVVIIP
jgi:hypothetical protein